jgi:hypothetical protein
MKSALFVLLLLSACDGEVLVDIDAGFPDAGVPDAGVIDDVDAGFDDGCELEDVEFPFECEPDADWCSPRDQCHDYYDLAAGWSHQLDEETWVVEVRTWGRLPLGVVTCRRDNYSYTALAVFLNSGESPRLGTNTSDDASPSCTATSERFSAADGDFLRAGFGFGASCDRCPPPGPGGVGRECEQDHDCSTLSVSADLTALRFEFPLTSPALFWSAAAVSEWDQCVEHSPQFAPSLGGSMDNAVWMPADYIRTTLDTVCNAP